MAKAQMLKVEQVRNGRVVDVVLTTEKGVSGARAHLRSGMRGESRASSDTIRVSRV